jgi:DME family drug/metabolite transporter
VFVSGFGLALYQLAFFAAARLTGAGVAAVIAIGSSPAIAGVMGYLFFHERLSPKWFVSTALAVGGGALLVSGGLEGAASIDAKGVALALTAGLAYALEGVGVRAVGDTRTPLETTAAVFLVSGLLTLPFLLTPNSLWLFSARGFSVAALLAVVSSALPFCLFTRGVLTVGVARSYTLTLSEPLTACLLSAFVLGQRMTATALAGVAVICAAIALLATDIKETARS